MLLNWEYALCISKMQHQWQRVITAGDDFVGSKCEIWLSSLLSAGQREEGRRRRENEVGWGKRFRQEGGVKIAMCWANGFFHRAAGRHQDRTGRSEEGYLEDARCRTLWVTSRRCSWDALSTLPALRPCLPTRPQDRTDTTSSPSTATLMVTAVRG